MNYSQKVEETVEYADLINKVQSLLDYIGSEDEQLKNDIELMHDDIQANIKQEKKALSQAGKQNDNA